MSAFTRFILPGSRRTYSSYFSSKSGGGRYFNSAKSSKNGVVAANNSAKDATAELQQDGSVQGASTDPSSVAPTPIGEPQSPTGASVPSPSSVLGSPESTSDGAVPSSSTLSNNPFAEFASNPISHVSVNAKDFKMHQFFSLHRPLLLINQPTSIFRPVPASHPIFSPLQPEEELSDQQKFGLDAPLDPFIDADAEAARQLTRALTMNKAASALAWENTMKHLGLDVTKDADRVNLQQQFDKDWEEVLLDSTKRKRRKKMKKHKLKKRRRATRSERLRMK